MKNAKKIKSKLKRKKSFDNKENSSSCDGEKYKEIVMSRAFYIPPQTQNNNSDGNHHELVNILVATLLSLLERRHRCTRRCCARITQQGSAYVSHKIFKFYPSDN